MKRVGGILFFLALVAGAVLLAVRGDAPARLSQGLRAQLIELLGGSYRAPAPAEGGEEGEEGEGPQRLVFCNGNVAVRIKESMQERTKLRSRALEAEQRRLEEIAFGRVADIRSLVEFRGRYHRIGTDLGTARVRREQAARTYERLRLLHRERANVSQRELQEARAGLEEARTRVQGLRQQLADARSLAEQEWGDRLVASAVAGGSVFEALADGRQRLVLLTLGPEEELPAGIEAIRVHPGGQREHARKATLVSPAPEVDPGLQGRTFFFRTGADGLRFGMRVQAWVPQTGTRVKGVRVPAGAVVWHGGSPWVYEQTAEDLFVRRPLRGEPQGGSWFVREGLEPGDRIVTAGAGMLLSEELRAQIPEEDEGA